MKDTNQAIYDAICGKCHLNSLSEKTTLLDLCADCTEKVTHIISENTN